MLENLLKLFQKYRKTEPTSLFILKNFVLTLLFIALLGYTWLIIWGIYDDNPVIQNSLEETNYIPAPGGSHDCNQYVAYGVLANGRSMGGFLANDLMFSSVPNNGISSLEFKIYLNDTRFNMSDSTTAIKPWGWIQKYGFKINKSVQTKLQTSLKVIPLIHHPKTTNKPNIYELKRRLDSLQLLLTEYVVNVQYLEEIYKANLNKKGAP
ncbi:13761_t:CDS:2 [Racocetra fulgida]|uniref:13761_t:CDS:1 n=1 Tax=Racocetra fulgida TaxID=60492 RepID=A0A9N8VVR9_9GLOM|nr:13761_t:CDS:2 [Racocetra fulgida]